jgi:hypothetical protein
MRNHVPPSQLWNEFQGDLEFDYDHDTYWPALMQLCEERREEQVARWEQGGKQFGESEAYIKGGDVPSVAPIQNTEVTPNPMKRMHEEDVESKKMEEKTAATSEPGSQEAQAPVQTNGSQANGNTDIAVVAEDPKVTTEGDRA